MLKKALDTLLSDRGFSLPFVPASTKESRSAALKLMDLGSNDEKTESFLQQIVYY